MNVELLRGAVEYIQENQQRFTDALTLHIQLSVYALLLGIAIFVPLGVIASRWKGGPALVGVVSAARVIPSISVLFLLYPYRRDIGRFVPFWDRNFVLALIALTLLAGPPLIINTDAALRGVSPFILENAEGLGMTGPASIGAPSHHSRGAHRRGRSDCQCNLCGLHRGRHPRPIYYQWSHALRLQPLARGSNSRDAARARR
jgi:hypothetical protein